jgi:hypothetical protein
MAIGVDANGYATIRANNGNGVQLQSGTGSSTFLQSNALQTNIPPSGTATSGGNFGSGDFYLQSSQWNGSAPITNNSGFFARTDGGIETVVNGANTGFFGASAFSQKVPIQGASLANGSTTQSYVAVVYTASGTAVPSTWHTVSYSCAFASSTTCAVALTGSTAAPFTSATSYSCDAPDMGTATNYVGYTVGNKTSTGFTVYASASNANTVYGTCHGS